MNDLTAQSYRDVERAVRRVCGDEQSEYVLKKVRFFAHWLRASEDDIPQAWKDEYEAWRTAWDS